MSLVRPAPGILSALLAAALFGATTPIAKWLLEDASPWTVAALLYLGSGVGLALLRGAVRAPPVRLPRGEAAWLAGAVLCGGVAAPVLLLFGVRAMPASGASLLLNAEGVFTALLAWFAFKENVDRRIALGMLAIVAGACVLARPWDARFSDLMPALAVLGACLLWGIDNNFTRKVSLTDAAWLAMVKGLVAGGVNLLLALLLGARWPAPSVAVAAMAVGFLGYGVSLALFVLGLRHLGAARTGAYFGLAPFIGAAVAVAFGEPVTVLLLVAGTLMAVGVWLHLTETHSHEHTHAPLAHTHEHTHDAHHQHTHPDDVPGQPQPVRHTHPHRHLPVTHAHPHFPDAHHQHEHSSGS